MRNGGRILIDQLTLQGVEVVFQVPGESFLAALDALFDTPAIRTVVCRHEGGAAMMAEAAGRLRGRPGIAFVTRAPGAANAVSGVYVAHQGQTPMILFVGLPPRRMYGLNAFQDFDLAGMFRDISKSVEIAPSAARLPELVTRAFALSMSGRPGPVIIGLPEDVLMDTAEAADGRFVSPPRAGVSQTTMKELETLIATAEQPLMIVGGPRWSDGVRQSVQAFAMRFDVPVAAAFRAQDYFDNRHACYAGHIGINMDKKLATAIRASDLLIVLGAPLDDIGTAGWTLVTSPDPAQRVVTIHPAGPDPRDGIRPMLAIAADAEGFAEQLPMLEPPPERPWGAFRRDLRRAFEASQTVAPVPGDVHFGKAVRTLSERLPEGAIIASGAGNFSQFVHRYFTYKQFATSLSPASGSMGYGLPAAIAAATLNSDATVIAFAGDGCFMMTAQELATAVQYGLRLVVIIADNGMYGTIRMHQERNFPGRVSGTTLVNPDFAALARSYGAAGITVTRDEDFGLALEEALAGDRPAVIALKLDPQAITPQTTLSAITAGAPRTT